MATTFVRELSIKEFSTHVAWTCQDEEKKAKMIQDLDA